MQSGRYLIVSILLAFISLSSVTHARPDFSAFTDVQEKKSTFFGYLHPAIEQENKKILAERKTLIQVKTVTPEVLEICEKYMGSCDNFQKKDIATLLERVDIIPPSLALAQAAKESGWGTSRFAVEGNNYFGQWCYSKGCGMVPKRRPQGATHEVKRFDSHHEAVSAYMHNLNTGRAYKDLRETRAKLRSSGKQLSSDQLAEGLMSYSERGKPYVKEIRQMIRYNNLDEKYDGVWQNFYQQLVN